MRMPSLRLILAVALMLPPAVAADAGRSIAIRAEPVPFNGPEGDRVGRLRYLTGLHLTSVNEDFGGFSGLAIDGERHLTAVSDRGHWLAAEVQLDARGKLTGLGAARIGRLCDDDGAPVDWERLDAEEVLALPGRGFLVSFERHHRIVLYPSENGTGHPSHASGATAFERAPLPFPFPPAIIPTRRNKGMEAVALLADGRLLTFAEDLRTVDDDIIGWIGHPEAGDWRHLTLPAYEDFLPTGAALMPSGDVLLLARSYTKETGNRVRLLRLDAASLIPGSRLRPVELARIEPPATIDNMEAVAVHSGPDGQLLIYLLSDDNYNDEQRTLLLQFELLDQPRSSR